MEPQEEMMDPFSNPSDAVDQVLPVLPVLPLQSPRYAEERLEKHCCRESVGSCINNPELLVDRASCHANDDLVHQVPLELKETGNELLLAPLETVGQAGHTVPTLPTLPTPMRNAWNGAAKSGEPTEGLMKVLNGRWFLQSNERPICDIWNLEIYFDPATSLKDTLHYLQLEEGTAVSLRMNGQLLLGEVSVDAQPRITWKHGEAWIKK
eukprot:s756_g3.t1